MRRFRIDFKVIFLGVLVLFFLLDTIVCNVVLFANRETLNRIVEPYFAQRLSVGSMFYIPPNIVLLRDLRFGTQQRSRQPLIRVPWARMSFSLMQLIGRRKVVVNDCVLGRTSANSQELLLFCQSNLEQIIEFLHSFPLQDIRVRFSQTRVDLPQLKAQAPSFMNTSATLLVRGKQILLQGQGGRDRESFEQGRRTGQLLKGPSTHYYLSGMIRPDGFGIDKLELLRDNFYVQLWGASRGSKLSFNGYMFLNTFFKEYEYREPVYGFIERGWIAVNRLFNPEPIAELPRGNINILDINALLDFDYPAITVEKFSCSFNNNPLSGKGRFLMGEEVSVDASLSSYLAALKDPRGENIKEVNAQVKGIFSGKEFVGDAAFFMDFIKKKKAVPPVDRIEVTLQGMHLDYRDLPQVEAFVSEGSVFCRTGSFDYRLPLRDISLSSVLSEDPVKNVVFKALAYDGKIQGRAAIDTKAVPVKISSLLRVKALTAGRLQSLIVHFSKVSGRLFSQIYFRNSPRPELKGGFVIENGTLNDFEFFKWAADFFSLPSLRKVDFTRAFSNFSVSPDASALKNIRLSAKDVGLEGSFALGKEEMVSSTISFAIGRRTLKESAKFTPLLRILNPETQTLRFNFKLSGNLHGMNFQWLRSDLKRELENSIPGFIQRHLEKTVEDALENISNK